MSRELNAVVIGGGMAGLLAAAALRPFCDRVLLLERDSLPAEPAPRRGVPQGAQLHNLLSRGQMHLEELLPGFRAALVEAGGRVARVAEDTHVFELGIHMPGRSLDLRLMCAWRPVIEHVARRLLQAGGGVEIRDGVTVTGLRGSMPGVVSGVDILDRDAREDILPADIVVDASGSGSRAPRWLSTLGCVEPPVDAAIVQQWFATMLFEPPQREGTGRRFWLTFPTWPATRGALVSPAGDRGWYVSVSGRANDKPPRTGAELLSYVATLDDPTIHTLLSDARGVTAPNLFHRRVARWRRYDLMSDGIAGFLPIGDAIASLNPLYGQGISVAAWQAAELARCLVAHDVRTPEGIRSLTTAYVEASGVACDSAWALGTLVSSPPLEGTGDDSLAQLIIRDAELHRLYVRVWHLLEPVSSLTDAIEAQRLVLTGGHD